MEGKNEGVPAELDGITLRRRAARLACCCIRTLKNKERDDPTFPKPVVISCRLVGYRTSEFMRWLHVRPTAVSPHAPRKARERDASGKYAAAAHQ
jgi:hypothetical protein